MLRPITQKFTDESEGEEYRFTFYCDICGHPRQSIPYRSDTEGHLDPRARENDHIAAYERANHEAISWFNRCPVCKRLVCDQCFRILDEMDMCKECAASVGR